MEKIKVVFVLIFSFSTILLLSSQCKHYASKKGKELMNILSKNKEL